jgi:hypothetical protein
MRLKWWHRNAPAINARRRTGKLHRVHPRVGVPEPVLADRDAQREQAAVADPVSLLLGDPLPQRAARAREL